MSPRKKRPAKKAKPKHTKTILCQQWEESEAGWGCSPDGYTLYRNAQAWEKHIKEHQKAQEDDYARNKRVPSSYTRTDGKPFAVEVSLHFYRQIPKDGRIWGEGRIPREGENGILSISKRTSGWGPLSPQS
jgi:hypothetical protein